jgi:hypothetical protein
LPIADLVGLINGFSDIGLPRKSELLRDTLSKVSRRLRDNDAYPWETAHLVTGALRLAAATLAEDGYARARASKAEYALYAAVEMHNKRLDAASSVNRGKCRQGPGKAKNAEDVFWDRMKAFGERN